MVQAERAAPLDVILYGAYGCVGQIAAHHLATKQGLRWAIAGRNETRLRALAQELASSGASSTPDIIVSPLTGNITRWVSTSLVANMEEGALYWSIYWRTPLRKPIPGFPSLEGLFLTELC